MQTQKPFKLLIHFGILLACCLAWTVLIPGFIANQGSVFYADQLRSRLPEEAAISLKKFDDEQIIQEASLKQIEKEIIFTSALFGKSDADSNTLSHDRAATLNALIEAQVKLRNDLVGKKPPISAIPFFLNPQLWLWPAIYLSLGVIIFIFPSSNDLPGKRVTYPRLLTLSIFIYIFYEWPLWLRNIFFSGPGRKVFAYPNIDIHPASFFMQESIVLGFCILVATLWIKWFNIESLSSADSDKKSLALDIGTARSLSRMLFEWQYRSVILAAGFGFFSNFFWQLVFRYDDQRYMISAINAHIIWVISWIAISLPLIKKWQAWEEARSTAIVAVLANNAAPIDEREKLAKSLERIRKYKDFTLAPGHDY